MMQETLIPQIGVVTDIRIDTPDVKTFRVVGLDGKKPFIHKPGQCAMLSMPGIGEAGDQRYIRKEYGLAEYEQEPQEMLVPQTNAEEKEDPNDAIIE